MGVRIGINPLTWSNDDLPSLGADIPLETCLSEAREAGFEGMELGHAMDRLVGEHDTKRGKGAVGILTAGLVDRQRAYEILVSYAVAPFVNADLYD